MEEEDLCSISILVFRSSSHLETIEGSFYDAHGTTTQWRHKSFTMGSVPRTLTFIKGRKKNVKDKSMNQSSLDYLSADRPFVDTHAFCISAVQSEQSAARPSAGFALYNLVPFSRLQDCSAARFQFVLVNILQWPPSSRIQRAARSPGSGADGRPPYREKRTSEASNRAQVGMTSKSSTRKAHSLRGLAARRRWGGGQSLGFQRSSGVKLNPQQVRWHSGWDKWHSALLLFYILDLFMFRPCFVFTKLNNLLLPCFYRSRTSN